MSLPGQGGTPSNSGGTPEGPQSQGPNDPIQQGGTPAGQQQQGQGGTPPPAPDQQDEYRELRGALSRERERGDTLAAELKRLQSQGLSDEEKKRLAAQDEALNTAKAREKSLVLRYEIAARAPKLGIVDPELAVMLIERNPDVSVGEDMKVTGLDDALKALVKERPHLVRQVGSADGGAGTGGRPAGGGKPTMNDIIRGRARGTTVSSE